jgi:hypothetical protein
MAQFRIWLWRFAMLAACVSTLFFVWMAFSPVKAPIFDSVTLRAAYWRELGFFLVQLGGTGLWLIAGLTAGRWRRAIPAFVAGALLFACIIAMASEYGSLIADGKLRDPLSVASHKLMVSRGLTLVLAVGALLLGWRARPKQ